MMRRQDSSAVVDFHRELLEQLDLGGLSRCQIGPTPKSAVDVADAPTRSYITNERHEKIAILFVSNEVSPGLVGRSVDNGIEVKTILGNDLGAVVLDPIAHGIYRDLSYSIWPLQRDLSSSFLWGRVQRRLLVPRVVDWLEAVARRTLRRNLNAELTERVYLNPLSAFGKNQQYPAHLTALARQALARVQKETLQPFAVLQHSDLWLGNVLLPQRLVDMLHKEHGFYVIDWGGATPSGLPFFDVVRFAASVRPSRTYFKHIIAQHCGMLACEMADAKLYLIAALANVGQHLEHFPESRYLAMCDQTLDLLSSIV